MLRKTMMALMTAAAIGMVMPGVAMARGGGGGGGGGHGGGGFGGGGAFQGGGLASNSDYDDGSCYVVRRRVHTKSGWHYHPVQVCS